MSEKYEPWFMKKELHFECQKCGKCCSRKGVVILTEQELNTIAEQFHETPGELIRKYYMKWSKTTYIIPIREGHTCPFLGKIQKVCLIYDNRPMHCRTYPAWTTIMATEDSWNTEGKFCMGIGRGPVSRHIEGIKKLRGVSEDEKMIVMAFRDCFLQNKPESDGKCRIKTCLFHQFRGEQIDKNGCQMYINVKKMEEEKPKEKE